MFKLRHLFSDLMDDALEAVKWFNSHSLALGLLRPFMLQKLGKTLVLILPVLTRWTSRYLCVARLLQLKQPILMLIADSPTELARAAGQCSDAIAKAKLVIQKLSQPVFWENLQRCAGALVHTCNLKCHSIDLHLRPLAVAANATQSDCARLDVVLVTLAKLYDHFKFGEGLRDEIRPVVMASLKKGWAKVDQTIFLLALLFNPYIQISCFASNSPLRMAYTILDLADTAFQQFFRVESGPLFREELMNYIAKCGMWSDESMRLLSERQKAKTAVCAICPPQALLILRRTRR